MQFLKKIIYNLIHLNINILQFYIYTKKNKQVGIGGILKYSGISKYFHKH